MKHPGEGASERSGTSGNEASGVRGARVPGRRVARAFLGRLALRPGPIEALGLGRLARRTETGPVS